MKLSSIVACLLSVWFLSSCTKSYTCTCTSTVGKASYQEVGTFIKKSEATSWCSGSNGADGSNVSCTLAKAESTKASSKKK